MSDINIMEGVGSAEEERKNTINKYIKDKLVEFSEFNFKDDRQSMGSL